MLAYDNGRVKSGSFFDIYIPTGSCEHDIDLPSFMFYRPIRNEFIG